MRKSTLLTAQATSVVTFTVQLAYPFTEALTCIPFACSRSQSLTVPPVAPATTTSSALSKETHSTALWCPDRLCRMLCHQQSVHSHLLILLTVSRALTRTAVGLPIAQTLTFLSSPPVTNTPADFLPIFRQLTLEVCATNSCSL